MRFAILNDDNVVVNVAIGEAPLADNWTATDTALIGDTYADGVFSTPEPDTDLQWSVIRTERNTMLALCDWTQLPDARVDAADWATYRQQLRDITSQPDAFAVIWPSAPQH